MAAGDPTEPTDAGRVVLDIGGDVGALLVRAPAGWVGRQVDLVALPTGRPAGHAVVWERQGPHGPSFVALFPALPVGDYRLTGPGGVAGPQVSVSGARVTETRFD